MPLNTWERILCRAQASLEGQTIPNIPISTSWNGQIAEVTYGDEHEVDRGRRMPGMSGSKVIDGRSLVPDVYQTTGELHRAVVTSTRRSMQSSHSYELFEPAWLRRGATSFLTEIPVERYGHCDCTKAEILDAFGRIIQVIMGSMNN